jgi:hypothetical protein
MKPRVFWLAVSLKTIILVMPCIAGSNIKETALNWSHKDSEVSFNFQKAKLVRGFLEFEIVAHNTDAKQYKCIYVTASDKTRHMNDDYRNEYIGATVTFERGLDNKLALNQKKMLIIKIPAPEKDVSLVNLYFGLFAGDIGSSQNCDRANVNRDFNFNQLNWDVSWIR